MPELSAPIFSVDDLKISFGSTEVVHGVSFSVEPGKTLAIVGESGSGKSASLLGATGLLPPTATIGGNAIHDGQQLLSLSARQLRKKRGAEIGFIFQDPLSNLHPLKTIGWQIAESISAHARLGRKDLRERVIELLNDVGISDPVSRLHDYPRHFSGGMRQRVMIAMAMAHNPGLIIADEPTTALDVTVQAAILDLMKRIQQTHGTALVFVSHDLAVVSDIADDVLVMKNGRTQEYAPAAKIFTSPSHNYTRELLNASHFRRTPVLTPLTPIQSAPLFEMQDVSFSVPTRASIRGERKTILKDVSFAVRENEILGLVGESGSGKSTIGRLVAGLERPDKGELVLRDHVYSRAGSGKLALETNIRRSIQVVFQDPYASLNPRRSIGSTLAEPFRIAGKYDQQTIRKNVLKLLDQVELPSSMASRYPAQLSGGQRQRIAIARAIALHPSLIVADEPVSALDITTQAKIIALIRTLRDELNVSFLFISHDLGVVSELCDRVLVLQNGEIVESGPVSRVLVSPSHAYTGKLVASIPGNLRQPVLQPEKRLAHV